MSYLSTDHMPIPDFFMAIFSLWFRVPSDSVQACIAAPHGDVLDRIIPLVTFGDAGEQTVYDDFQQPYATGRIAYDPNDGSPQVVVVGHFPIGSLIPRAIGSLPVDPSVIGVQCANTAGGLTISFYATFQTTEKASVVQGRMIAVGAKQIAEQPTGGVYQPTSTVDASYALVGQSGNLGLAPGHENERFSRPENYQIAVPVPDVGGFPDAWHHALIAFDVSNNISTHATTSPIIANGVNSYNLLYVALDDVNYTGTDAFPNWPGDPLPPNATITDATFVVAGQSPISSFSLVEFAPIPVPPNFINTVVTAVDFGPFSSTASFGPAPIKANTMGFPASAAFQDNIVRVEMAEFQMFTGIVHDTADIDFRRAFIDGDGKPVHPSVAEKFLGQKPDVLIHGSNNWIKGRNTGSLGLDLTNPKKPKLNSNAQFDPTALIKRYRPDPSLT